MNICTKFQLIPIIALEKLILLYIFWQIKPFGCHGNLSNFGQKIWKKIICLDEDY